MSNSFPFALLFTVSSLGSITHSLVGRLPSASLHILPYIPFTDPMLSQFVSNAKFSFMLSTHVITHLFPIAKPASFAAPVTRLVTQARNKLLKPLTRCFVPCNMMITFVAACLNTAFSMIIDARNPPPMCSKTRIQCHWRPVQPQRGGVHGRGLEVCVQHNLKDQRLFIFPVLTCFRSESNKEFA